MKRSESPADLCSGIASSCPEDTELISRVLRGESAVFERLVRKYQDSVYGLTCRLLGENQDAEDAAQEVFLRAYRGLGAFEGRSKLSTWLYRIAYNLCTDRLRSRRQAKALEEEALMADGDADPESLALVAEERRAVRDAIRGLRDIYRNVIVLRYYQGLSAEEIEAVCGLPRKTVETRLYRARKALRKRLGALRERTGNPPLRSDWSTLSASVPSGPAA